MKRVTALLLLCALPAFAKDSIRMTAKIIDRQTRDTDYSYQVPGYSTTYGSAQTGCADFSTTTSCNTSGSSNTVSTAPHQVNFSVTGATLALQITDGRIAVVNCVSKFQEHFAGRAGNHRSCRIPLNDTVDVEFKGDNAKLMWPVSLDGKKIDSETYRILSILPARQLTQDGAK